jgi:hypothetical protein
MNSVPARGDARRRRPRHLRAVAVMLEVAPVLAVLLVSSLGLWAFTTYAERRAAIRTAETERYLEQFEQGPVADAWQRLHRPAEPAAPQPVAVPVDLASDIDLVRRYFERLALCVRMGSCDPTLTSRRLGNLPWRFLERYGQILQNAYPDAASDPSSATASPLSSQTRSRPFRPAAGGDDVRASGVRSLPGL